MPPELALQKALDAGLDLVEVSPDARPPVCKIIDFGKYKYQLKKKANEAKKRQEARRQGRSAARPKSASRSPFSACWLALRTKPRTGERAAEFPSFSSRLIRYMAGREN